MSSSKKLQPILVLGATGGHGGTGAYLVRRLREEGHAVRVLARTLGERTDHLAQLGAEVVVGDLFDRRTLTHALADVDLAYFTYPIAAGIVDAAANYAAAVREVGRRPRTVVMSMGPAHPDHPSHLGRAQWLAEQLMEWAGLRTLVLRVAALFHQNLAVLHAQSIRRDGAFGNSFGSIAMPWISGSDAAELALAALLYPERFDGDVVYPRGSELFSHDQVAELMSDVLGRTITFHPVGMDQWREQLVELAEADGERVVNPAMAQHISSVGHVMSQNGRTLDADHDRLTRLIGRTPVTLREFVTVNQGLFAAAD